MRLGLTIFPTDQTISPVELATQAEQRGYHSLWFPEHTHIPASRATPAPAGEPLETEYYRAMDPVAAIGACIGVTTTLRLGSGIALVAQHHPISYAKSWATLDLLAGGRIDFGIGFGWNREEMAHHGVDYVRRREVAREHVLAMQRLWVDDPAEFHGDHVEFEPSHSWPKPVQRPRIPTYLGGGAGPQLFAHVAEYGDGWIPIGGAGIRDALPALHEAWAAIGRDGSPAVVPFGALPSAEKLEYYAEIGCPDVVLRLPAADRETVLGVLDHYDSFLP